MQNDIKIYYKSYYNYTSRHVENQHKNVKNCKKIKETLEEEMSPLKTITFLQKNRDKNITKIRKFSVQKVYKMALM